MTILRVEGLSFSYRKARVLDQVVMTIKSGEIVGLIGENGAGKSTLMKLIAGVLPNDNPSSIERQYKNVGALIEQPALYTQLSVAANITFFCQLFDCDKDLVADYIERLGLANFLNKKVKALSLGMKQRVGVVVALIASREFLLLDEPTNGLDPSGIKELLETLRYLAQEKGISILISSHILQNLEQICDRYFILKEGKLQQIDKAHQAHRVITPTLSLQELRRVLEDEQVAYRYEQGEVIVNDVHVLQSIMAKRQIEVITKPVSVSEVYFENN